MDGTDFPATGCRLETTQRILPHESARPTKLDACRDGGDPRWGRGNRERSEAGPGSPWDHRQYPGGMSHETASRATVPAAAGLDDVLITDDLSGRAPRPPEYEAENRALVHLAHTMVDSPENILQMLAEAALDLCNAQTAGISLLESSDAGEEIFRWRALAGTHASQFGRDDSPQLQPLWHCPRSPRPAAILEPGTALRLSRRGVPFTHRVLAHTLLRGR